MKRDAYGSHKFNQSRGTFARSRGQALVPVLFVLVILTSLAVTFSVAAHNELRASANFANRTSRYYAARGALNYALAALSQTSNNGAMYGVVPANPDADSNGWWQIGDAWVKVEVVDTGSRLDLNAVTAATLNNWPVFQTNSDIAAAIVSWRTPQSTSTTSSGASGASANSGDAYSSYYTGLTPAYQEKNAPFETVNELLLVENMTPAILYGTMAGTAAVTEDLSQGTTGINLNSSRASSRQSSGAKTGAGSGAGGSGAKTGSGSTGGASGAANSDTSTDFSSIYSASTIPVAELFTTLSREREIAVDGTPRVNINTASASDLENIGLTSAQANRIIQYRQSGGQTNGGAVVPSPTAPTAGRSLYRMSRQASGAKTGATGSGSGAKTGTTGTGSTGTTGKTGTGGTGSGTSGATGTTTFKTLADLLSAPGITVSVMQQIADKVATDSNTYREHVVNVNTAPQEVLASVPGMDMNVLNAILTARQSGQTFQSLDDLFTLSGITLQEYQAVIASLTAKTSTYLIRIKVRVPGEKAVYAVEALTELTDNGPLVLQWREVPRTPGWSSWVAPAALSAPTGSALSMTSSGS